MAATAYGHRKHRATAHHRRWSIGWTIAAVIAALIILGLLIAYWGDIMGTNAAMTTTSQQAGAGAQGAGQGTQQAPTSQGAGQGASPAYP